MMQKSKTLTLIVLENFVYHSSDTIILNGGMDAGTMPLDNNFWLTDDSFFKIKSSCLTCMKSLFKDFILVFSDEILKIFLSALWPLEIIITANIEIKRIIFQFFEELSLTKKSMFKKDFKFFIFFERF